MNQSVDKVRQAGTIKNISIVLDGTIVYANKTIN